MEIKELAAQIKREPHWRVNIRPHGFNGSRVERLSDLHSLMQNCKVSLRGWDYPHIDRQGALNGNEWIESGTEFLEISECWRLYQSLQFIHYFNIRENKYPDIASRARSFWTSESEQDPADKYLEIDNTLFRLTEIYLFAKRLVEHGNITTGVDISISLSGVMNSRLFYWNPIKSLHGPYICKIDEISLFSQLGTSDLILNYKDEALKKAISIFERFNWNDPPNKILKLEQEKFLENR